MKQSVKKRIKTNQPKRQRRQLDIGELAQVYGGGRFQDEGTKGGGDATQI
jgi:hypothetical protein